MKLAKVLQLAHGQLVAREVQQRIQQHGAVAVGQHKAVAVMPLRVTRVVLEVTVPQHLGNVCHAHGGAGVAGLGLLYSVHRQHAHGIGHAAVEVGGFVH